MTNHLKQIWNSLIGVFLGVPSMLICNVLIIALCLVGLWSSIILVCILRLHTWQVIYEVTNDGVQFITSTLFDSLENITFKEYYEKGIYI